MHHGTYNLPKYKNKTTKKTKKKLKKKKLYIKIKKTIMPPLYIIILCRVPSPEY